MDVSANIRAARVAKGISQAELSRRLELDASSYHRLENRGIKLSIEQVQKIAAALEVSFMELLTWGAESENDFASSNDIRKLQERIKELEEKTQQKDELINVLLNRKNDVEGEVRWKVIGDLMFYATDKGFVAETEEGAPAMSTDEFLESNEIGRAYIEGFAGSPLIQKAITLGIVKSEPLKEAIESLKGNRFLMRTVGVFTKSNDKS